MIMLIIYIIGVILMPLILLTVCSILPNSDIKKGYADSSDKIAFVSFLWPICIIMIYFYVVTYFIRK